MKGYEKWNELLNEYSEEELKNKGYKYDEKNGVLSRIREGRFESYILGTWFSIPTKGQQ